MPTDTLYVKFQIDRITNMDSTALSKVNILKSEPIGGISISHVYISTRTFCV